MAIKRVKLSDFDNSWYQPGSFLKRLLWYLANALLVESRFSCSTVRVLLLRLFGASVGEGVVIKPRVRIKYPWKLSIADNVWIGEEVWIDNLASVTIKNNVCISQGAYLLCGNHDYSKEAFDLIIKPIDLEEGVWIGAKAIVCPGVRCGSHAVLGAGSVTSTDLAPYSIYRGNPARRIRDRTIL